MLTSDGNIDYENLVGEAYREAMRGVVRRILEDVVKNGLRGEQHYYISFYTEAPGVSISKRLLEKYPAEMTIVLQHKFWDLSVQAERFQVKLSFNGIPELLVVPYAALKVFFDPSVRFGYQFDEPDSTAEAAPDDAQRPRPRAVGAGRSDKKRATSAARKRPELVSDEPQPDVVPQMTAAPSEIPAPAAAPAPTHVESDSPKVISLDKFRKK